MRLSPFQPHSHSITKKPFLLLEILIAILLVSLCLIPLIRSPIETYCAQMRFLEEMEGERIAEWSFSEVKEKLLKNEIPWDKLPTLTETSSPIPLPPITIQIPGSKPKKIERSFVLRCGKKGEKTGLKGEIYRVMHIDIYFTPQLKKKNPKSDKKDYTYRLMVRKLPKDTHNLDNAL